MTSGYTAAKSGQLEHKGQPVASCQACPIAICPSLSCNVSMQAGTVNPLNIKRLLHRFNQRTHNCIQNEDVIVFTNNSKVLATPLADKVSDVVCGHDIALKIGDC